MLIKTNGVTAPANIYVASLVTNDDDDDVTNSEFVTREVVS